jgi:5-methylcytosine-specific restriction endonuclease McrA
VSKQKTCLALNATYEPLHMVRMNQAVRFVLEGKAEVEEQDESKVVRSEKITMPKPTVIRLKNFVHVPRNLRSTVTNTFLFARDNYTCAYCGRTDKELRKDEFLNRDHIIPQSKGGPNTWLNCITACSPCNNKKDNRTPQEARMKLRFQPVEPHFVHLKWCVRKLTPMQLKYIARFYGEDTVRQLERLVRK